MGYPSESVSTDRWAEVEPDWFEEDIEDESDEEDELDEWEDLLTDAEADAMTLESAGWGTDEDYGFFDNGEW